MSHITFSYKSAIDYFTEEEIKKMAPLVETAHHAIDDKTGAGSDFLGWIDLPTNYDKEEFERIKETAEKIKENSDILLVIGIGGSYLGARAAIEMLTHSFQDMLPSNERKVPQIFTSRDSSCWNWWYS